jgi:hypothetical protein
MIVTDKSNPGASNTTNRSKSWVAMIVLRILGECISVSTVIPIGSVAPPIIRFLNFHTPDWVQESLFMVDLKTHVVAKK